jgi:hypothetical protein
MNTIAAEPVPYRLSLQFRETLLLLIDERDMQILWGSLAGGDDRP